MQIRDFMAHIYEIIACSTIKQTEELLWLRTRRIHKMNKSFAINRSDAEHQMIGKIMAGPVNIVIGERLSKIFDR